MPLLTMPSFTALPFVVSLQATHEGPSGPEDFVQELKKFDFADESATENHHGTIDKLRVSLSTNGLGSVQQLYNTA